MVDFITRIFDTTDFSPALALWHCPPFTVGVHIVADMGDLWRLISPSPACLIFFVLKPVMSLFRRFSCCLGRSFSPAVWGTWWKQPSSGSRGIDFRADENDHGGGVLDNGHRLDSMMPRVLALPGLAGSIRGWRRKLPSAGALEKNCGTTRPTQENNQDLERFSQASWPGRSLIELKARSNALLRELGRPPSYLIDKAP